MYSSTLSLTSALDVVGSQRHSQVDLAPGRDTLSILYEAGYAPGPMLRGAENHAATGIRSPDRPDRSESGLQYVPLKMLVYIYKTI
jgi:hypothetical protein